MSFIRFHALQRASCVRSKIRNAVSTTDSCALNAVCGICRFHIKMKIPFSLESRGRASIGCSRLDAGRSQILRGESEIVSRSTGIRDCYCLPHRCSPCTLPSARVTSLLINWCHYVLPGAEATEGVNQVRSWQVSRELSGHIGVPYPSPFFTLCYGWYWGQARV